MHACNAIVHELTIGRRNSNLSDYVLLRPTWTLGRKLSHKDPTALSSCSPTWCFHVSWGKVFHIIDLWFPNSNQLSFHTSSIYMHSYLQCVPIHRNASIFGCQWLSVAWNPSKQLVCASGDNLFTSFTTLVFVSRVWSLSYATVPGKPKNSHMYMQLSPPTHVRNTRKLTYLS